MVNEHDLESEILALGFKRKRDEEDRYRQYVRRAGRGTVEIWVSPGVFGVYGVSVIGFPPRSAAVHDRDGLFVALVDESDWTSDVIESVADQMTDRVRAFKAPRKERSWEGVTFRGKRGEEAYEAWKVHVEGVIMEIATSIRELRIEQRQMFGRPRMDPYSTSLMIEDVLDNHNLPLTFDPKVDRAEVRKLLKKLHRQGKLERYDPGLYSREAHWEAASDVSQNPIALKDYSAYCRALADAYDQLPMVEPDEVWRWELLADHVRKFYRRILSKVDVHFVPGQPYDTAEQMRDEVSRTGVLLISSDYNEHPVFDPETNLMFRAVHDYVVHIIPGARGPDFSEKGEIKAYNLHRRLAPKDAWPALFTEVAAQACYANARGEFPVQKVALVPGFDYYNVGLDDSGSSIDTYALASELAANPRGQHMDTMEDFTLRHGITMTCNRVDRRSDGLMRGDMDHWKCTLRRRDDRGRNRSLTFYYSMGYGHRGRRPEVHEVLSAIQSDTTHYLHAGRDLDEWANDLGWDPEDRSAKRTFRAVESQADKIEKFLDDDAGVMFVEFCDDVEPD